MARQLIQYDSFSRKEVHDIFDPDTRFTTHGGPWGMWGIVKCPNTIKDYVLFVTIGSSQGNYDFVEDVYDNGTMTWQSQPQMDFENKTIKNFLSLNPSTDTIYMFLRTSKKDLKYIYIGTVTYVNHDKTRKNPVFFTWQIDQFDQNAIRRALPKLVIKPTTPASPTNSLPTKTAKGITQGKPPVARNVRNGISSDAFKKGNTDYLQEAKKNTKTGNAGEDAVVEYERQRLITEGCPLLASKVVATRNTIGNSAKYDVHSYNKDGSVRFVEVKTTKGSINNSFYISEAEVAFSEQNSSSYYLYRLYNFDPDTLSGDFYILTGAIDRSQLKATNYMM